MVEFLFLIVIFVIVFLITFKFDFYERAIVLSGLLFKVILSWIHFKIRPLWASSDQIRFEDYAINIYEGGWYFLLESLELYSSYFFSSVVALVYLLIRPDPMIAAWFGSFVFVLCVCYSYSVLAMNISRFRGKYLLLLLSFLPSVSLLSSVLLRDIYIISFFLLSFSLYIHWIGSLNGRYLFWSLIFLLVTSIFHHVYYFLFILILINEVFVRKSFKKSLVTMTFSRVHILVVAFFVVLLILTPVLLNYGANISKFKLILDVLDGDARMLGRFAGGIVKTNDVIELYPPIFDTSLYSLILSLPERLLYFLFKPVSFTKITDLYRIFDTLLVFVLLLSLVYALVVLKRSDLLFPTAMLLFLIVLFTYGSFDVATGVRHRIKVLLPMIVLIWVGMSRRKLYVR